MISLFINNTQVNVPAGTSILQACEALKINVPRFCFHSRLLIAGNCRMCLVEVEKMPKPIAACAMPVEMSMRVFTKSFLVDKARESVLEFLLINHPLDCPVCDQGGSCDLQEQSFTYGSDNSRFYSLNKKNLFNPYWGPVVNTLINRCIYCTRCVRFMNEVAGFFSLGLCGRGASSEIGVFFLQKRLSTFFSGNVVDLCPVGFLYTK